MKIAIIVMVVPPLIIEYTSQSGLKVFKKTFIRKNIQISCGFFRNNHTWLSLRVR